MNATGMKVNKVVSKQGGNVAKKARLDLEKQTGQKVVTSDKFTPTQLDLIEDNSTANSLPGKEE